MCRARLAHRRVYGIVRCVCQLPALRHFFFLPPLASFLAPAAAGSSSGPCHGHRKSTKRRSLCTCQRRSTALVIRHGEARHGRGGGRCSVPARTRRVWRRRSSPAPRRRASGLPGPARAASRPSRSPGPPRLPSRGRAGAQGLGGKPAAPSLAAGVAVHGRLHHSARSGIT